jgi:steroid delta-isomerase
MKTTILARSRALLFAFSVLALAVPSQAQGFDPAQGVQNYFAVLSSQDLERYMELFAPDAVFEDPVGGPVYRGRKEIYGWVSGIVPAFSELDFTVGSVVVVSPNQAAADWSAVARTLDGRLVHLEGVGIFVFNDDGKIRQLREYWDLPGLLAQLAGQTPQPRTFPFQAQADSWFALAEALNLPGYVDLFTHDGVLYDPVGTPPYRSHGKILEHVLSFQDVLLSIDYTVIRSIPVSDTEIALQWTLDGKVVSGKTVHIPGITILRFNEEGKIRSAEEFWSLADFLSQL